MATGDGLTIREASQKAGTAGVEAVVVVVEGELDAGAAPRLLACLERLSADLVGDLVVDLTGLRLLSAPGVRALATAGRRLAGTSRRLRVVTGDGHAARVLRVTPTSDTLDLYPTMGALRAARQRRGHTTASEVERLRAEVRDLRDKLASRPVVARALGMLQERYRMPDGGSAFTLLREISQRHNVKLRVLARTLAELPPPEHLGEPWPATRMRPAAPALSFLPGAGDRPVHEQDVFDAALDAAVAAGSACGGELRLAGQGRLRGVARRGPSAGPATARAAGDAMWSTPLLDDDGCCLGVLSTHHLDDDHLPTPGECAELDAIAAETARWLRWQRREAELTALAALHSAARRQHAHAGAPPASS